MYIKDYIENNDSSATEDFWEDVEQTDVDGETEDLPDLEQEQIKTVIEEIQKTQALLTTNLQLQKRWLFENLLYRNTVSIIDGLGSTGKSTLALQLALVTITQKDFLLPHFSFCKEEQCADLECSNVLYLTTRSENPLEITKDKIDCITGELNIDKQVAIPHFYLLYRNETILTESKKGNIEPTELYFLLQKLIKECSIELLVIDPLSRFLGTEENSNKNINIFYNFLEKLHTTTLLIHHQPKISVNEKIENTTARGASALRENARCRLVLKSNTLLIEKNNYSQYQGFAISLEIKNFAYFAKTQTPVKITELKMLEKATVDTTIYKGGNGENEKARL